MRRVAGNVGKNLLLPTATLVRQQRQYTQKVSVFQPIDPTGTTEPAMKTGFVTKKVTLLTDEITGEKSSASYQIGIIAAAVLLVVSAAFL
jgi:hypothetical protein